MKILLFPLIALLQIVYLTIVRLCGSYGISLLFLSLLNSFVMLWLGNLIKRFPQRESLVQSLMAPKLEEIKKETNADVRHNKTIALYRKYSYHPILAIRSAFPLLLQLPFLFAAFHMLSNLNVLQGVKFLFIQDLSRPDALIFGIHLLPVLMTLINVVTALITPGFRKKDKIQAIIIAGLFLILLYRAASALLIFWTANNLIFFTKTLYLRIKHVKPAASTNLYFSFGRLREQLPELRQFFALLCVFYVYQIIAIEDGHIFVKYLKYIPFFVAATGLWITQFLYLKKSFTQSFGNIMATAIFAASIVLLMFSLSVNISIDSQHNLKPNLVFNIISHLLMLSAFAMGFMMPKTHTKKHGSPFPRILLLILLSSIPAVHYARVNADYLLGLFRPVFYLSIPLLALGNYLILHYTTGQTISKNVSAFKAAIFTAIVTILPVIRFSLRSSGNVLMKTSNIDLDMWVVLFVALLFGTYFAKKERLGRLNQIVGIILAVFILSGFFYRNDTKQQSQTKKLNKELQDIVFKEKPNIYLFVYDGIPNERVFKYQNLPFDRLRMIFDTYSFKLYDDTYSLGPSSLSSMGMMLDFNDKLVGDGRSAYSGNSLTNLVLRNNGYKSRFLLGNYYTGHAAFENAHLYDELFPHRSATAAKSDFFFVLMRGIFQGEMRFDTRGLVEIDEVDDQAYKLDVIKELKESTFIVNHYYCPGHSQNSGQCLPNETELWLEKLDIALEQMEKDFEAIKQFDPNSIVIAIGDHGPSLTGDCYNLDAWKREEITEDLVWDRIGTMLAIRWPDLEKAEKYDKNIVINQDVFPVMMSYLTDDPKYLTYCPKKTFWGLGNAFRSQIGFNQGKIILY